MVKMKYILLLLIAIMPNLLNAMALKNIEIKDAGITVTKDPAKGEINACKKFKPTKQQLIAFFKSSEVSKENKWLHEYYSSCVSTGNVEFENGVSGEWVLQSSGLAMVIPDNGDSIYFFKKNNSWEDPMAGTYGLDN
ncbi:TPA: hypothetical protein ACWL6U_000069 [Morganella morganii]|nr:hypothetical protein [Morganella morganii]